MSNVVAPIERQELLRGLLNSATAFSKHMIDDLPVSVQDALATIVNAGGALRLIMENGPRPAIRAEVVNTKGEAHVIFEAVIPPEPAPTRH